VLLKSPIQTAPDKLHAIATTVLTRLLRITGRNLWPYRHPKKERIVTATAADPNNRATTLTLRLAKRACNILSETRLASAE
jgi:hypothetical protein